MIEPGRIFAWNVGWGCRPWMPMRRNDSARGIISRRASDDPFSGRAMLYAAQLSSKTMPNGYEIG